MSMPLEPMAKKNIKEQSYKQRFGISNFRRIFRCIMALSYQHHHVNNMLKFFMNINLLGSTNGGGFAAIIDKLKWISV